MSVEVINLSKSFGTFEALKRVNLRVDSGELVALLGPSGSGKTTLLRLIGGLEFADGGSGTILFDGQDLTNVPAGRREVGFVFQHYALFRHLSVFENIAFGLRVRPRATRPSKPAIQEKVHQLLKLVQLEGLASRQPHQLSGGQRQRVALARALAVEPKVLLLDEPFGALDAQVRKELRRWLRHLHQEIHVTSIFVTHDQDEALEVADRIVVMQQGTVEQMGTPNEVYERPANPFVYRFLGRVVALRARIDGDELMLGSTSQPLKSKPKSASNAATVFARPQDIRVAARSNGSLGIEALVREVNLAGPVVYLHLERLDDGSALEIDLPAEESKALELKRGSRLHLLLQRYQIFVDDRPVPL